MTPLFNCMYDCLWHATSHVNPKFGIYGII